MIQRRRHGKFRVSKPNHLRRPKSYKVVCSDCGKEAIVEVPPPNDKKYCVWSASPNRDI